MFPEDMREQKKKLMAMLGLAVTNLHKPETVVPALQTLGRQHVSFGTQAAHYEPWARPCSGRLSRAWAGFHACSPRGLGGNLYARGERDEDGVGRGSAAGSGRWHLIRAALEPNARRKRRRYSFVRGLRGFGCAPA